MGIRSPIKRSTPADTNEARDWRIYAEFAQRLITHARKLYAKEDLGQDRSNTVYAPDSTTIDLYLSMFPWAPFRSTKAAVKMHTLLDLRGNAPSSIHVSYGKLHDVNALDLVSPETAALYVMDRAYVDFERLFGLHEAGALSGTPSSYTLAPELPLVSMHGARNKFSDFVCYIVQRLKTLNSSMGIVKISETLCLAGLLPGYPSHYF